VTVALAKDVADFLREQVSTGVCADAGQLVNDVLRSFRDQQHQSLNITPELEAWLLEAADQPSTPLAHVDFNGIRKRVRARIRSRRP
jgi:Arc/MetJ-type ribon-helix-helix transcriptional regulator